MLNQNRNLGDLTPDTELRVREWLAKCKKEGLNILITETKRSKLRQLYLYSKGRYISPLTEKRYLGYDSSYVTPKGQIHHSKVTWTLNSNHLKGEAIDFGFMLNGSFTYNGDWTKAYDLAESCGLKSLFRETGYDRPHLNFNKEWIKLDKKTLKRISDKEKILKKRAKVLNKALNDYNAVIHDLSNEKGIIYKPFIVTR